MKLLRVSKKTPCPVCGKPDWCWYKDGYKLICMRVQSKYPQPEGGYYHKSIDKKALPPYQKIEPKVSDFTNKIKAITTRHLNELASQLGLTATSLRKMQVGFDGRNYLFPMKNAQEKIIGIRVRTKDGKKFSIKGSSNGLFIPVDYLWWSAETLYICEGATDCAALIDLGFESIGRPSCSGGAGLIKQLLSKKSRNVVIVSDNDSPKIRPDGSVFIPGQEGAARLAREIKSVCRSVQIIKPPFKDIREWYRNGCRTIDILRLVI